MINRRARMYVGAELLIAVLVGTLGLVATTSQASRSAAEEQVRAAFAEAVRVEQGVRVPPLAHAGDQPQAADLDRQLAGGTAAIRAIFADQPAAPVIAGLNNAVESQRTSSDRFRILGAGVGDITFREVTLRRRTATGS